ncbi:hypothetical protein [Microbacterium excoecariae]|uniref:hypothetical protein n=1 Tax=Microbacterium excoecariae TaxID=2715210 RepID=UPI0014078FA6|nr:hypothetical protein [Microbacterium excoecariae]NHI16867.1 hypothetical protein [Microbacterium excoecariae]
MRPETYDAPQKATADGKPVEAIEVDTSWLAILGAWRLVVADLALHFHVDLYDPAVLARPWPGIRTMIFSLFDQDTRLRRALTRR